MSTTAVTSVAEEHLVSIERNYLVDVKPVQQVNCFPLCLLNPIANDEYNITSITKFNFIMSKEHLEKSLLPLFALKSKTHYNETFYDLSDNLLMMSNYWLKEETSFIAEPQISIKRTYTRNNQTLNYKCAKQDMCPNLAFLMSSKDFSISFSVTRTTYELKTNKNVTLTIDQVFYKDLSSFVVLSICGPSSISDDHCNSNTEFTHMEILQYAKPCRSKIVECLFRTNKDLYSKLVERNHVLKLNYESMCIATFEVGEEKAELFRKQAEELKRQMEIDGEDTLVIDCAYCSALVKGDVEYPDDEGY